MDQQQQSRWRRAIGQLLRWRPTRTQLLWAGGIAALAFLTIVICGYLFGWKWTGLPKQTLWDWLQLLIIPAVLAGVGLWFNRQQREQELQTADSRAQDEALQAYLDQMSGLLLEKDLRASEEDSEVRTLARARTLTVLSRMDPSRKTAVMQFLEEAQLVMRVEEREPIIMLNGADLRGADLRGADFIGADFIGADLRGANLRGASLIEAGLSWALLWQTDLRRADLRGAGLFMARGWREKQLAAAMNLEGAFMPNGQRLKSKYNPDGPTFEEWLTGQEGKNYHDEPTFEEWLDRLFGR